MLYYGIINKDGILIGIENNEIDYFKPSLFKFFDEAKLIIDKFQNEELEIVPVEIIINGGTFK